MSAELHGGAGSGTSPLAHAPVVAEVVRNGFVESVHHGIVATAGPDDPWLEVGPVAEPVLPRSSLKPLQAVAMLRAGAELSGKLLALACASHSGEEFHRDGALAILRASGLDESSLQNTPGWPIDGAEDLRWVREGRAPTSLAQNCSGKHAAMLATCVAAGWDTGTYRDPGHPLQRLIVEVIEELTGDRVTATTVDGCGAPAFAVSPLGLARAFGHLASARPGTAERTVADAIRAHPEWLGGTARDVTDLIRAVPGLIAKDGAESVYAAGLADGRGVVVKIADGSERARAVVLHAALRAGAVTDGAPDVAAALEELDTRFVVHGHGQPVGAVRAVLPAASPATGSSTPGAS